MFLRTALLALVWLVPMRAQARELAQHVIVAAATTPASQSLTTRSNYTLADAVHEAFRLQKSDPRSGGAIVQLEAGEHRLQQPLRFGDGTGSNSNTTASVFSAASPLVVQSEDSSQRAVVTGGVRLANWTTLAGKPWLWVAHLPAGASAANISSLWVGDTTRRSVARSATVQYADSKEDRVVLNPNTLPKPLTNAPSLRAVIFHCWTASYHDVASVSTDGLTVMLRNHQNVAFNKNTAATGKRVYFEGHPDFLTNGSGTFIVDTAANTVTYAPTPAERAQFESFAFGRRGGGHGGGGDDADADEFSSLAAAAGGGYAINGFSAVAPQLVELVRTDGSSAAGVALRNINFSFAAADFSACIGGTCDAQSASFLTTAAVHFENASGVQLTGVDVSHVDGNAVWVGAGSRNVAIDRLHVTDVGAGGVRIGPGIGGVTGDSRADHVSLTNSTIEDGGE